MGEWGIKTAAVALMLGLLAVQGCTLIPGMKMKDNPADKNTRDLPPTADGEVVEVQTLSNDLINQLAVEEKMKCLTSCCTIASSRFWVLVKLLR